MKVCASCGIESKRVRDDKGTPRCPGCIVWVRIA